MTPPRATDPCELNEMLLHRDFLVRYARGRLHDAMLAEDAVHDVYEAALSGRAVFAGRSALRTWLVGILRNKIADCVRKRCRRESREGPLPDDDVHSVRSLGLGPDELLEQRQRLQRTLQRIETLPVGLRNTLQLYVLQEQTSQAVCRALAITEDNLHVRLHRARLRLLA